MEVKQCIFTDEEGTEFLGIMVDNKFIICTDCGGVFEVDEVSDLEVLVEWKPLS